MFSILSSKKDPIKLWFHTDIHCHVLPGIDDGSTDPETSVSLISGLHDLGIDCIVASPHIAAEEFPNTHETLGEAYSKLKTALAEANINIPVEHSAEYRIDDGLATIVSENRLIPYPGNYVLIENSWIQEPWNLEQLIFDLQIKGFNPIMAHPERFIYYHNRTERYDALHSKIPFQVNVLSLAGHYGKGIKSIAELLLKKGYVDFLGTDTHNQRHINVISEYLKTKDARRHRDMSLQTLQNDRVFPVKDLSNK